ncbi:MAG: hypothetical protein ACP5D4_17030 [Baaleninema sp.]
MSPLPHHPITPSPHYPITPLPHYPECDRTFTRHCTAGRQDVA